MRIHRILALTTALAFGVSGAALAQQGAEQPPDQPPAMEAEDVDVSEDELESVANAYVRILEIREQYQPSLAEAEDQETAQELQREANEEMVRAVEEEGLDVETYNQIVMAAEADEDLRQRLFQKIDEAEQR